MDPQQKCVADHSTHAVTESSCDHKELSCLNDVIVYDGQGDGDVSFVGISWGKYHIVEGCWFKINPSWGGGGG